MGNRYIHKVSVVANIRDGKLEPPIFPCAKQGATGIQGPTGPSVVLTVSRQSSHTDLINSAADFYFVKYMGNRDLHKVSVVADIRDGKLEPPIFPCAKRGATRIQGPTGLRQPDP